MKPSLRKLAALQSKSLGIELDPSFFSGLEIGIKKAGAVRIDAETLATRAISLALHKAIAENRTQLTDTHAFAAVAALNDFRQPDKPQIITWGPPDDAAHWRARIGFKNPACVRHAGRLGPQT